MGFKMYATPFLKSEKEAKQQWMQHISAFNNVPIDVVLRATVSIKKVYFPYARFDMICAAGWSAESIWEHEEQYQVAREKMVYIDYNGKEHKTGGQDREYRNGRYIYHTRQAVPRTVYETKTKTVIDNIQQTAGNVGPLQLVLPIALAKMPNINWTNHFRPEQLIEVDDTYFKDFIVTPTKVSDVSAAQEAQENALSDMKEYAKRDIPGDRFEKFGLDFFDIQENNLTHCFLGVYQLEYEYDGKTYTCFISGGTNDSDILFNEKPVDNSIEEHSGKLNQYIKKTDSSCILIIGVILIGIIDAWFLIGIVFGQRLPLWIVLLLLTLNLGCLPHYILNERINKRLKKEQEAFKGNNTFLRQQVLELVQNNSISDTEKEELTDKWLAEHSSTLSGNQDSVDKMMHKHKTLIRFINIIAIAAAVLVIVLNSIGVFNPANNNETEASTNSSITESKNTTGSSYQRFHNSKEDYSDGNSSNSAYTWDTATKSQ